jgi:ubiquinone/menaquinone biosynthesis C-methylase UbiE
MTVLDIGFGNGYYSFGMAHLVGPRGRVIAVETESEKVASLRQKIAASQLDRRIEPRLCTAADLAVDDLNGQFDFALAFFVVHHADDVKALMIAVHRALTLAGTFLIVEPSHHASDSYCRSVEADAGAAGLSIAGHPKIVRTWTLLLRKAEPLS